MTSRFVLATNHVCEIMLRWLELGAWGEAFMKVMPKRKGGVLKAKRSIRAVGGEGGEEVDGAEEGQDGGRGKEEQSDNDSGPKVEDEVC